MTTHTAFLLTLLFTIPGLAVAHEGEKTPIGEWIERTLTVKHDSSWSTEHCLQLTGRQIVQYRFTADIPLKFDFHVHPVVEDGGYHTEYLDREAEAMSRDGRVVAEKPGTYCFNFIPVERNKKNIAILLAYRITEQQDS